MVLTIPSRLHGEFINEFIFNSRNKKGSVIKVTCFLVAKEQKDGV